MKYKSTLFDEARNKIGGIVASANKDGNYFRAKVTPRNPKSAAQLAVRATFTDNSKAWRGLTDIQRAGWTSLAAQVTLHDTLGNKYKPSGQQLYVSCNSNLATIGAAAISTAPGAPDTPGAITYVDFHVTVETAAPHTQTAILTVDSGTTAVTTTLSSTALYSPGRSFVGKSQLRTMIFATGTGTILMPFVDEFNAKFGNLVVGSKLTAEAKVITPNGFAGPPVQMSTIVAAA